MPIKLYRTQAFREGAEQGQILHLDDDFLKLLRWLDRTVCDRNYGRSQPDSPFKEIDDWYNDGRYWSDAYNTRWNVAVTLYYLATHPDAYDFVSTPEREGIPHGLFLLEPPKLSADWIRSSRPATALCVP